MNSVSEYSIHQKFLVMLIDMTDNILQTLLQTLDIIMRDSLVQVILKTKKQGLNLSCKLDKVFGLWFKTIKSKTISE